VEDSPSVAVSESEKLVKVMLPDEIPPPPLQTLPLGQQPGSPSLVVVQ
jgi:hypothetical protein